MSYRILVQVNYSSSGNPEGDSGLHFIANLINKILEQNANFHFYVLVPISNSELWKSYLNHPNITCIEMKIAPRSHGGEFQFNPLDIYEIFKLRRYEVDIILVNQPEVANAYYHLFNKLLFHNVPIFSYVHWFDKRSVSSKNGIHKPILMSALTGMISSEIIGCNSKYGQDLILNTAKNWFKEDILVELKNKFKILPPGFNAKEFDTLSNSSSTHKDSDKKRIIINHRVLKYTGVRDLLTNYFPRLWDIRKDFDVILTNPSKVRLPKSLTASVWLTIATYDRKKYVKVLQSSDIVICPHKATHWSISTLEAIYAGCVPIMNGSTFFKEMIGTLKLDDREIRRYIESNWFYSGNNLIYKINKALDNIDQGKVYVKELRIPLKENYDWNSIVKQWIDLFIGIDNQAHKISESNPSYKKIVGFINDEGEISKHEILKRLGWGPQSSTLTWSAFRNRLKMNYPDDARDSEVTYKLLT